MTNIVMVFRWRIEIDGLPWFTVLFLHGGSFQFAMFVITRLGRCFFGETHGGSMGIPFQAGDFHIGNTN